MQEMPLRYDLCFDHLQSPAGLEQLDQHFMAFLANKNCELQQQLIAYRQATLPLTNTELSELLIALGYQLDHFLVDLFQITDEATSLSQATIKHNPIALFKKTFLLQKAKRRLQKNESLAPFDTLHQWLLAQVSTEHDLELAVAHYGNQLLEQPEQHEADIERLTAWCIQAIKTEHAVTQWSLFKLPQKLHYQALVPLETAPNDPLKRQQSPHYHRKKRDGFKLTDTRMSARDVQGEVNYCVFCHDHDGDLCSKGFPVKKQQRELGYRKNPLDITLTGCPLEEKISEMQFLKRDGYSIGALAMIMVDNPMCPATGHRICNDCMKSCIYQKQTPVDIPQIETRTLTDVLSLPWGIEIYDLLTKWNPLRQQQYLTQSYNGKKILIAGMGPAGFTLAHHLLQEGYAVVGIDGLKLEPLPTDYLTQPIKQLSDIEQALDKRPINGFGGVAEYGITSRWDKNFLTLIYINLMRRQHFQAFGNVRFGGTVHISDAWKLGFDHMVIAVGAGLPRALPIPGSLVTGMRQANDFLMALQLTGAAKKDSLANLQLRLPAVVIGGGLTGVDTATEAQAYYITQVEKIHHRYHTLKQHQSEQELIQALDIASIDILQEFLQHGSEVIAERARAKAANELPDFTPLIRQWGGVTILYRKHIQDSPAYVNNHEELAKALEEGLYYLECLNPSQVEVDQHGHAAAMQCDVMSQEADNSWQHTGETVTLPCKSILVATGASLNIAYAFEHQGELARDGMQYRRYEQNQGQLTEITDLEHCKQQRFGAYTSYQQDQHRVTFIGDTHPVFHGNVVKAIASAKRTYPEIHQLLAQQPAHSTQPYTDFRNIISARFNTIITKIERKTDDTIEITIKAPMAIQHYQPGQFYRLQNLEADAITVHDTKLQTEGVAAFVVHANTKTDELTFMISERGASSRLFATFNIGQRIGLMGPTGVRSKVTETNETILIMGDILSLSQIRSYGTALKQANNRIVYLAAFDHPDQIYCQHEIETIADQIIWVTQHGTVTTHRKQDNAVSGDPIDALIHYAKGHYTNTTIPFSVVDRIQVIGNSHLLKQVQQARKQALKPYLPKNPKFFGSVYSTMQCMLKGVCAQCLQWQIDPDTGRRKKAVFACSWQDQPLELIDYDNINERLRQNQLQEHLTDQWLQHVLTQSTIDSI